MAETSGSSDDRPASPPPPASQRDRVGATLRRIYDEAATEPLPSAFEELLRKLD